MNANPKSQSGDGLTPPQSAASGPMPSALAAFTRVELLVVLAVLTVLAVVVLPALASQRPRSARVICANNLRQIGMAMQSWGNDHDDLFPWEVHYNLGGTSVHPLAPNVWLHFSWVSNELVDSKLLFCPADAGQPARDFSGDPAGGYVHPSFANRATSYFLTHAFNSRPNAILAGDRNVGVDSAPTSCSRFLSALYVNTRSVSSQFQWANSLHQASGNVLHFDGRVEQLSNRGLRTALSTPPVDDNGSLHLLLPR